MIASYEVGFVFFEEHIFHTASEKWRLELSSLESLQDFDFWHKLLYAGEQLSLNQVQSSVIKVQQLRDSHALLISKTNEHTNTDVLFTVPWKYYVTKHWIISLLAQPCMLDTADGKHKTVNSSEKFWLISLQLLVFWNESLQNWITHLFLGAGGLWQWIFLQNISLF